MAKPVPTKYYTIVMRDGWEGKLQVMAVTSESERLLHGSSEFGGHATRVVKLSAFGKYKSLEAAANARDDVLKLRAAYTKAHNEAKARAAQAYIAGREAVVRKLEGRTDG